MVLTRAENGRTGPKMAPNRAENGHFRPCSGSFSALFATRAENGPFSALVRTIFGPVRNQGRKWAIFGPDHVDFHALGHSVQNWIRLENVSVPMGHPMEPSRMNPAVTTHVPGMHQPIVVATG